MSALLLEIGMEEIPASMIAAAQAELAQRVTKLLARERIAANDLRATGYSTPRRLAVLAEGILDKQADMEEELVGPSLKVAYKEGAPTPAAIAFARKSGVEISALKSIQNAKGEYVSAIVRRAGRTAAEVLTNLLPAEIGGLSWPKSMYWRGGKPERFVRPVRWLLALLDEEVLPVEFAGVRADGKTYGHRVLHGSHPVVVQASHEYVEKLESAFVQVDAAARKQRIRKALDAATRTIPGARWREDGELVDIVANLTEWPTVILGSFEKSYLDLPEEVLVTVMRDHQKYFALESPDGKLLPNFLTVLNIEVDAAGADVIRHGNARVLRARFNDARFFWDVDQKIPLVDRVEMLKNVTFQKDLGSYWEKTQRVSSLAEDLTTTLCQGGIAIDKKSLMLAANLAKTDLTCELVKEFTELQGIVGGLYALEQGQNEAVSKAIYWQYRPAFADDLIPLTTEGQIFGIADRMDTLASMFRMNMLPVGSSDPFALRRAGNAIVKTLAESDLPITLQQLVDAAYAPQNPQQNVLVRQLYKFLIERMEFYLRIVRGFDSSAIRKVLSVFGVTGHSGQHIKPINVADIVKRARDVNELRMSPEYEAISSSFKRIKNILGQAFTTEGIHSGVEPKMLIDPSEKELYHHAQQLSDKFATLAAKQNYLTALWELAALRPTIDTFFERVMVMVEDDKLRRNRIALMQFIYNNFLLIADFSE